ncbi:hypothetical protein AABM34_20275 [Lysinibacillus fusiformis]
MTNAQQIFASTEEKVLKNGIELFFKSPMPLDFNGFNKQELNFSIYGVTVKIPQSNRYLKVRTDDCIDENWSIYSIEGNKNELHLNYSWNTMDPYFSLDDLLECEVIPLQLVIEELFERDSITDYKIQVTLIIEEY